MRGFQQVNERCVNKMTQRQQDDAALIDFGVLVWCEPGQTCDLLQVEDNEKQFSNFYPLVRFFIHLACHCERRFQQ